MEHQRYLEPRATIYSLEPSNSCQTISTWLLAAHVSWFGGFWMKSHRDSWRNWILFLELYLYIYIYITLSGIFLEKMFWICHSRCNFGGFEARFQIEENAWRKRSFVDVFFDVFGHSELQYLLVERSRQRSRIPLYLQWILEVLDDLVQHLAGTHGAS